MVARLLLPLSRTTSICCPTLLKSVPSNADVASGPDVVRSLWGVASAGRGLVRRGCEHFASGIQSPHSIAVAVTGGRVERVDRVGLPSLHCVADLCWRHRYWPFR